MATGIREDIAQAKALGIAATTATFSVLRPVLLAPLPYPDGDRLVTLWETLDDGGRLDTTFATQRRLGELSRSFSAIALLRPWQPTLEGGAGATAERLDGQRVSASWFAGMCRKRRA